MYAGRYEHYMRECGFRILSPPSKEKQRDGMAVSIRQFLHHSLTPSFPLCYTLAARPYIVHLHDLSPSPPRYIRFLPVVACYCDGDGYHHHHHHHHRLHIKYRSPRDIFDLVTARRPGCPGEGIRYE